MINGGLSIPVWLIGKGFAELGEQIRSIRRSIPTGRVAGIGTGALIAMVIHRLAIYHVQAGIGNRGAREDHAGGIGNGARPGRRPNAPRRPHGRLDVSTSPEEELR